MKILRMPWKNKSKNMSQTEIESLLKEAIKKLQYLENRHNEKVSRLEERISYLEEMLSSQKNMLSDSMKYINDLKSNGRKA